MTEWLISLDPKKYDFLNGFRNLNKINLKQSTNVKEGDIVYIYASDEVKSIKIKCRVNKIDIELTNIDSIYNLSSEINEYVGKYMELEMIEEFNSKLFSKSFLEKYGFIEPLSMVRLSQDVKEYLDVVQYITTIEKLDPTEHDGSYEMVNEIIRAYATMDDLSVIDYRDLNLVYLMTVGTWKHGITFKKILINDSNLPETEKKRLMELFDYLWSKTEQGMFSNCEREKASFGLFGTGFNTFKNKADKQSSKEFIKMCIDIQEMIDEEEIFERCSKTLTNEFKGMRAAAASMVLHCLNPYVFPVFTSNMGSKNIFEYFGVEIKGKTELQHYIENVRKVREFRNQYFATKNYRVFDMASWKINKTQNYTNIDYLGVLDYLENNREIPYSNPEKLGIDPQEKERLLDLKSKAQTVIAELKKMADLCKERFNLDKIEPMSWLDASNVKTRKYLWCQLKYSDYSEHPESISIFVEMSEVTKKARYRLALELKNEGADKSTISNYHRHLDLPLQPESSLVYVSGSNEYGEPQVIDDDQKNIKLKVASGEYKKVQISRIIEWDDELTNTDIEQMMLEGISELIPFYDYVIGKKITKQEERSLLKMQIDNFSKNTILYGPPGTGKTYNTIIYAVAIIEKKTITEIKNEPYEEVFKRYNTYKNSGLIAFTTFHQSYGYEDFIEGIKPVIKNDLIEIKFEDKNTSNEIGYIIEDGVFKKFCNDVCGLNTNDNQEKNYVFIIDEINRGNISKIFGELITLIEDTKRKGMEEEISAILPYSKKTFNVPANVYILGTMNTADRSIAIMDTALRRRFEFIEMMPDVNILRAIGADKVEDLDVATMLEKINERISLLYDREHTIGHAFFTKIAKEPTIETLKDIFEKSVIPLLQEYFYEDYQKIQFVLGDNEKSNDLFKFILDRDIRVKDIFKGSIEDVIDLPEKKYFINKEAFSKIESYKEII